MKNNLTKLFLPLIALIALSPISGLAFTRTPSGDTYLNQEIHFDLSSEVSTCGRIRFGLYKTPPEANIFYTAYSTTTDYSYTPTDPKTYFDQYQCENQGGASFDGDTWTVSNETPPTPTPTPTPAIRTPFASGFTTGGVASISTFTFSDLIPIALVAMGIFLGLRLMDWLGHWFRRRKGL